MLLIVCTPYRPSTPGLPRVTIIANTLDRRACHRVIGSTKTRRGSPMSLPVAALRQSRRCGQRCDSEAGRVTLWTHGYTAHQPADPRCKRTPARRVGTLQLRPAHADWGTQPLGQAVRG